MLQASPDDRFIGSAPLAFTFGLGGHVLFPFRIGAATIQLEKAPPDELLPAIAKYKATVCFTAPTAYRAMIPHLGKHDISSLRICVSAGETMPKTDLRCLAQGDRHQGARRHRRHRDDAHLYRLAGQRGARPARPASRCRAMSRRVVDDNGNEVPRGTIGRLAVRGPTGCRYLADARQTKYVQKGWNFPGDTYVQDADGYFWYQARSDDMIISSGYNIAGPEVEEVLLAHPAVAECGVVGAPDPERGHIVKAYIVLRDGHSGDAALTKTLQDYVKNAVAPYKYPRAIEYVAVAAAHADRQAATLRAAQDRRIGRG